MDYKQVEFFLKLYEELNFTKTAKELYISQQGLSKSIHGLEKELGILLFERSGKKVTVTEAGQQLYDYFKELEQCTKRFYEEVENVKNLCKGTLRFISSIGAMYCFPMDFMVEFRQRYPDIVVICEEAQEKAADELLKKKEWDVGFLTEPIDENIFHKVTIFREKVHAYVHKEHPAVARGIFRFSDLNGENLLFYPQNHKSRNRFDVLCRSDGIHTQIVFESSNPMNMLPLVEKNKGVMLCIPAVFRRYKSDDIVELPVDWEDEWSLCLAWKKNRMLSMTGKLFLGFVDDYFKDR